MLRVATRFLATEPEVQPLGLCRSKALSPERSAVPGGDRGWLCLAGYVRDDLPR